MKHLLLVLILTAALTACKKDEIPAEQLPAATTTGANTAGCYVDGKLWKIHFAPRSSPNFNGSKFYQLDGGQTGYKYINGLHKSYYWM